MPQHKLSTQEHLRRRNAQRVTQQRERLTSRSEHYKRREKEAADLASRAASFEDIRHRPPAVENTQRLVRKLGRRLTETENLVYGAVRAATRQRDRHGRRRFVGLTVSAHELAVFTQRTRRSVFRAIDRLEGQQVIRRVRQFDNVPWSCVRTMQSYRRRQKASTYVLSDRGLLPALPRLRRQIAQQALSDTSDKMSPLQHTPPKGVCLPVGETESLSKRRRLGGAELPRVGQECLDKSRGDLSAPDGAGMADLAALRQAQADFEARAERAAHLADKEEVRTNRPARDTRTLDECVRDARAAFERHRGEPGPTHGGAL